MDLMVPRYRMRLMVGAEIIPQSVRGAEAFSGWNRPGPPG